MKVVNVVLDKVGVKEEQYPINGLPEIALAGKSNVGKSTLINALINRKALARTSSQPGKTQTINFYKVEDLFYFVDLPGYGYAKVSKEERQRWGKMIESYLHTRQTLLQVMLLVDARHRPSANDRMMLDWIRSFGYQPLVVATKTDKVRPNQRAACRREIIDSLAIDEGQLFPFEGSTKKGDTIIWGQLESILSSAGIKVDNNKR